MAETTPNLRLSIPERASEETRSNLAKIDALAGTFGTSSSGDSSVRALGDVTLEPEAIAKGGTGSGGTVNVGTGSHTIDALHVYATALLADGYVGFLDIATGGSKYLRMDYDSSLSGSVDAVADRTLTWDLQGADRGITLGGSLTTAGALTTAVGPLALTTAGGGSSLTLPATGTLSTLSGTETLAGKTLTAPSVTGHLDLLTQGELRLYDATNSGYRGFRGPTSATSGVWTVPATDGAAGQVLTTNGSGSLSWSTALLGNLTYRNVRVGSVSNTDAFVNTFAVGDVAADPTAGLTVKAGVLVDAQISSSAAIARSKVVAGSINQVIINDGSGLLSSEAQLAVSRGGTGASTANGGFGALAPTTTRGDLITRDASANVRLGVGAAGTVLRSDGTDPSWGQVVNANVAVGAAVARSKIASGTASFVVVNDGTGVLSEEAQLAVSRGGTGNGTALNNNRVMQSSGGAIVEAAAITASRALASDTNGIPVASATTSTELGFLSGVTSSIQTQLNAKETSVLPTAQIFVGNGSNVATAVAVTGDISITSAGVVTIVAGAVTAAKIATGTITDTQISAAAAIARSKIATDGINQVVINDGTGALSAEAQLAISRGGTGQGTASAAFDALAPTTTRGDLITRGVASNGRLATGTSGQVLVTNGTDPSWAQIANANVSNTADIARAKIAAGTANQVVINDGTGVLSSEATLAVSRGGTGAPTAANARTSLGVASVDTTWATADGATKAITHSLGTLDVVISVYDENGESIWVDTVTRTSTSVATLVSSVAPTGNWRVLIQQVAG